MDIGNEDGLLIVADVTAVAGPVGAATEGARLGAEDRREGRPARPSLDFAGAHRRPSGKLEVATLVKGDGPVVKSGQKILASYLGQIPKGKKPFDESYSAGRGLEAVVGGDAASVVKGWSEGLVGLPVGSRVLAADPAEAGLRQQGAGRGHPGQLDALLHRRHPRRRRRGARPRADRDGRVPPGRLRGPPSGSPSGSRFRLTVRHALGVAVTGQNRHHARTEERAAAEPPHHAARASGDPIAKERVR